MVESTLIPSYKRADAPQVATSHKAERGVTLERRAPNGKALKGDRYLLPGFEEYDFIAVQHLRRRKRPPPTAWAVYERYSEQLVAQGETDQAALAACLRLLERHPKAALDHAIETHLERRANVPDERAP
jgi:hypothetical protein